LCETWSVRITRGIAIGVATRFSVVLCALGLTVTCVAAAAAQPKMHSLNDAKQARFREYNFDGKDAVGRIVNLTPYTWTFVGQGTFTDTSRGQWDPFPQTLQPGQQFVYRLHPWDDYATTQKYDGWFTYRADTVKSGTNGEYLSIRLNGSHCTGVCFDRDGPALSVSAYDGTRAPKITSRPPSASVDFGPQTPNPEINWTLSGTTDVFPVLFQPSITADFDYTYQTTGNYTIDGSKDPLSWRI
jgi:hypothetical protein